MSAPLSADKALLDRLPLPLAQLYRRALNAKSARDAHDFAFYLWEAALKLLASSAVVTFQRGETDPNIAERLKVLARPSLGHWWEIARILLPILAERGVDGYRALNEILFGRARADLPRCAGLDAALTRSPSRSTVQVGELFDHLIAYRNKTTGHGAPAARSAEQSHAMADVLLLAAAELFEKLDVLAGRRLIYVAEVRALPGIWLVERAELHGVVPWRIASLEVTRTDNAAPPLGQGVWLSDPSKPDDPAAFVALTPLVTYEAETETTLILNRRRSAERVELLCYVTGRIVDHLAPGESLGVDPGHSNDSPVAKCDGGRVIGEYDIVGELGRGAMGVVYRAWQPSLGREVALKVQPRAGDAKADARFRREIRALGRVEHPHVVKVYISGSDGDQFYYTMEMVDGAPLAAVSDALTLADGSTVIDLPLWKDALAKVSSRREQPEVNTKTLVADSVSRQKQSLSRDAIRHIVTLIRQAAEAAHALHEKGIIHRDIKPGNVLVSADGGSAVLMDLGLAQLADDLEGRLTRTRQFVGTLRYASPQQVLAVGQLDRRADVYSLGATLWELLALRPLFGAADQTPTPHLMEKIQREEPERLRRVASQVGRDLEAIVHKCFEKSPTARYTTAQDLADDLGRWLAGEPVRARKVSAWEREWKWIRRRPVLSGLAAALLLAIAGGTLASWVFAAKAEREAEIARNERDRTRQALDDMTSDVSEEWLVSKSLTSEQRSFLLRAVEYYREFSSRAANRPEESAQVARARLRLGEMLYRLGKAQSAEESIRAASEQLQRLPNSFQGSIELMRNQAACERFLGWILFDTDRLVDAELAFNREIGIWKQTLSVRGVGPRERIALAHAQRALGDLYHDLRRYDDARREFNNALAILDTVPADQAVAIDKAILLCRTGSVWASRDRPPDARADLARALEILENAESREPTNLSVKQAIGNALTVRIKLDLAAEQFAAAEPALQKLLSIREMQATMAPADHDVSHKLAATLRAASFVHRTLQRLPEAEAEARKSEAIYAKLAQLPDLPDYQDQWARSQTALALVLESTNGSDDAERLFAAAVKTERTLVASHRLNADYRRGLAIVLSQDAGFELGRGRSEQALALVDEALSLAGPLIAVFALEAEDRANMCRAYVVKARALCQLNRPQEGLVDWTRAKRYANGRQSNEAILGHAEALARLGRGREAAAEINAMPPSGNERSAELFNQARILAICANASQGESNSEQFVDTAISLLRQLGNNHVVDYQRILNDSDFARVRSRPEFADLLWKWADATAPEKKP